MKGVGGVYAGFAGYAKNHGNSTRCHKVEMLRIPLTRIKWEFDCAMAGIASKECNSGIPAVVETSVEAALFNWRRKAVDVFMACSALVYLPAIILVACGLGPPLGWIGHFLVYTSYSIVVLAALLKRLDHRLRLYAVLSVAFLTAVAGAIVYPGLFMRALPVALPIIGLVLGGFHCGRLITAVSAVVILFMPLLNRFPAVTHTLRNGALPSEDSLGLMVLQSVGLTAMLLALMILLERFYSFLEKALIGQHQAVNDVERKVVELTKTHDTLTAEIDGRRKLEREVTRIADDEKRRLGLEIHDGVCQQITGAMLRCEALARRLDRGQPAAADDVRALSAILEDAVDEAHGVARGLFPLESSPNAIAGALRALTRRTQRVSGVSCRFITTGDTGIPDPVTAQNLFRIAQEAVSNAARHARATRITVELHGTENGIRLQVADDGDGMPAVLPPAGMGLRTMACRAHLLEGEFAVRPAAGGGTAVCCKVRRESLCPTNEQPDPAGDATHGR